MSIKEQLTADMKEAMKSHDKDRLSVIRFGCRSDSVTQTLFERVTIFITFQFQTTRIVFTTGDSRTVILHSVF